MQDLAYQRKMPFSPKQALQGSYVFPDVTLVPNYDSYKEKTIKLLPYDSFYVGHIPLRKIESSFSGSPPQKSSKPQGPPFSSILLRNFKSL